MSASKSVFSFFDPAEINKSFSSKTGEGATTPKSTISPKASSSGTPLSRTSSRSSYKSATSPANSTSSPVPDRVPSSSTGDISIQYNNQSSDDTSCNSQITERAANKSPEVTRHVTKSISEVGSSISGAESGRKSQSSVASNLSKSASSSLEVKSSSCGVTTREANYDEGASELFLLVESASWQEAITRVNQCPEEARVWINSSGTENTVFSWSVWRRLPLHEACRRQPPPVLIYALLAAYPQSTGAESHFGELPLHAAVRCGACAEVVNCLLAAYPAAVFARDNSGCTPLDILNGTGKMMDHDAVAAALSRTIAVLTKEEQEWNAKIKSMEKEFASEREKKQRDYERMVDSKSGEITALKRELGQEKLATSNLAKKVIQTEKVVELKSSLEARYQERLIKCEEDIKTLKNLNAQRKAKIKEMEGITAGDRANIEQLNSRVEQLQAQLTAVCDDEETFVATTVARAEAQMKVLMEAQLSFIKEQERKKDRLRGRIGQLGIALPPKKFPSDFDDANDKMIERKKDVDEPSDEEVAEKALAAAMAQFTMSEESNV